MHRFAHAWALALAACISVTAATSAAATGKTAKPPTSVCGLLDDARKRSRMDGLIHRLAARCDRPDLLGQVGSVGREPRRESERARTSGADVRVNDPSGESGPSTTQSENSIARSEVTGTLCSAYNDAYSGVVTGEGFTGFARSQDDGASFIDGGAVDAASYGDPSMLWRRKDGHFYLSTLHASGLAVYRSTDDCQTFALLSLGHLGNGDDKELMTVDNHAGSDHYGRLYLVWTDFANNGRIFLTRSDDGVVWSTPVALSANGADVQGAWPVVAPDGTLYVGWVRWNPFFDGTIDIEVVRSDDGGQTFAALPNPLTGGVNPYSVDATLLCGRPALNGNVRYLPSPQLAVTPNGDLHVVYSYDPDGRGIGDVIDVFYRRSTNRGQSFEPEVRVSDDTTQTDQFFPTISAGPNGRIVIAWYDRRLDEVGNLLVDYYSTLSDDGGLSFGPNLRLSDESSPIFLDPGLATCYHGDYDGSLQTASSAFVQWSDDRAVRGGLPDPDAYVEHTLYEPDFFIAPQTLSAAVCAPDSAAFDVLVGQSLDFPDPVTLSATGYPQGTSVVFGTNPVVPEATTELTVFDTAAGAPGVARIEVVGTSGGATRSAELTLVLATDVPSEAELTLPIDGASAVEAQPTLMWNAVEQAASYTVEIATDEGFTNIVASGQTSDTTYRMASALALDSQYYWRVTATNVCGSGAVSTASAFTTQNLICVTAAADIPDNTPAGLDSAVVLASGGALTDLDVRVDIAHTWVGDLAVTLAHEPSGARATLIDRPGYTGAGFGCSNDNVMAVLDDAATAPVEEQCSGSGVAIDGTFAPNEPLSVFNGVPLAGTWSLNVSDSTQNDFGTLNEWCLQPVVALPDADDDGVADASDNCTLTPNSDQRDTDTDGIGNACDADLNNDCLVNVLDLGLLRTVFFTAEPDADFDGDGVVNAVDLGLMRVAFFQPPGPAAAPNACTAR